MCACTTVQCGIGTLEPDTSRLTQSTTVVAQRKRNPQILPRKEGSFILTSLQLQLSML